MNAHLSYAPIALLIAYAGGLAGGQLLFKMAQDFDSRLHGIHLDGVLYQPKRPVI